MKTNKIISLLIFSVLLASCQGEPSGQGNDNGKKPTDKTEEQIRPGDPIDVIDGKVRFYIGQNSGSIRKAAGIDFGDWSAFKVSISGVDYPVLLSEDGEPYIEADPASSYNAVLYREESAGYYGLSRYVGVVVPITISRRSLTLCPFMRATAKRMAMC